MSTPQSSAALPSENQINFHHLVLDIAWFGLALPATTRFLSVYAIRVGATADHLIWLTALPAIMLLISATLGNWWMRRYQDSVRAIFWPALFFRFAFLLPALTPFVPHQWQVIWLILSLTLPALPQGLASVVFGVLMREAIDDKQMTPLLSKRSLAMNITIAISGLALGFWLEKAPFPLGYQVMFLIAFAVAMVSLWHVMQIHVRPAPQTLSQSAGAENPWFSPAFLRVAFVVALTHIAFFSVFPVTPLRLVNELGAGEWFMAIFALVELGASAATALFTNRIAARIGNRSMMALGMISTGIGAFIIALSPGLNLALLSAAFLGAGWTATAGVGLFAYLSENTSPENRLPFTTAYTQVAFLSMFIGPMIGKQLSSTGISLVTIILLGAGLRLLAGVLIQSPALDWFGRAVPSVAALVRHKR